MKDVIAVVEYSGRKTITVTDIIFVLNRVGYRLHLPTLRVIPRYA